MKVKTYSNQAPRALVMAPIWSRQDAIERAKRMATALEGYGYERMMPRTRDGKVTWELNSRSGFTYAGRHSDAELSLKGCARLLAKGQNIWDAEDKKLRAELNKHPTLTTEAVLSGAAKSGDMVSVLKAVAKTKKVELTDIFSFIPEPNEFGIEFRLYTQPSATIHIDRYGGRRIMAGGDEVSALIMFLQNFEQHKQSFLKVRAHMTGLKIPHDGKQASP